MTQPAEAPRRHPSIEQVAQHFAHDHLPTYLSEVSAIFAEAKDKLLALVKEDGPELTVSLRKLLEAKDAGVRAKIEDSLKNNTQ